MIQTPLDEDLAGSGNKVVSFKSGRERKPIPSIFTDGERLEIIEESRRALMQKFNIGTNEGVFSLEIEKMKRDVKAGEIPIEKGQALCINGKIVTEIQYYQMLSERSIKV